MTTGSMTERSSKEMEDILTSSFGGITGCISRAHLTENLGSDNEAESFLVDVMSRPTLLHWRRSAAITIREYWVLRNTISVDALEALWAYSVGQLSRDPDELSRLVSTTCHSQDALALKIAEKHAKLMVESTDPVNKHWGERIKRTLEDRAK